MWIRNEIKIPSFTFGLEAWHQHLMDHIYFIKHMIEIQMEKRDGEEGKGTLYQWWLTGKKGLKGFVLLKYGN